MKKLSNLLPEEFLQKHKWQIVTLFIIFTIFLLFPFVSQQETSTALQVIILGASTSVLYAILAVGFSLIYGVAKQLKLSLGGYYVVAGYTMYFLLEAAYIQPLHAFSVFTTVDGLVLLGLILLPLIFIVVFLVFFWTTFEIREFLFILLSPIVAGGSLILFGGSLVGSLFAGVAVLTLGLAGWYLELPKLEVAVGTFIFGVLILLLSLFGFPANYISLMIVAIMLTAFLAMIVDHYILYRFRASHVNTMIVTFSIALLLQSIVQILYYPEKGIQLEQFGPERRTLEPLIPKISNQNEFLVEYFDVYIENIRLLSMILSIIICIILYLFIWYSKIGMALRAVSQDEEAAALAGIDIRKVTAIVSGIGMGLIGFASILTSPFAAHPMWSPYMGWWVLIMAIAVVTLGGMGSLPGSFIAAFIMGYAVVEISSITGNLPELIGGFFSDIPFLETISSFIPNVSVSSLSVAVPFVVVLIVMIIKPEGLIAEKKELEEG